MAGKIIQGKPMGDSGLSYFLNQLTKLDQKFHAPLYSVTFGRDIQLREDVSLSNESTSYIRHTIAAGGNISATGAPWINSGTTALQGVDINGALTTTPLRPLALTLSYTELELLKSQETGFPLDASKMNAINTKYQMSTDKVVYYGDTDVGATGLFNKSGVTYGAASHLSWMGGVTTPAQILAAVNDLIESTWSQSGFTYCPTELRIPPAQFAYIAATPVTTAGSLSILAFLEQNSISMRVNGKPLNIQPVKWLTGTTAGGVGGGAAGTDRMVAYTKDYDLVRFPMVPIQGFTPSYRDLIYSCPYVWALGETEIVYPETIQYADGI